MTPQDSERLAQLRAQYTKWEAIKPEGFERWEGPFLLKIIDEINKEIKMSQRFSDVKYDEKATELQEAFKGSFERLELMGADLLEGRAKSLFLTALEEAYMWVGKAIRDEQITRGSQPQHVPERG